MLKIVLVIFLTTVVIHGHNINKVKIRNVQKKVKNFEEAQSKMYDKLNDLETSMTEKIKNLASGGGVVLTKACPAGTVSECVSEKKTTGLPDLHQLETRLTSLEHEMDEIINYLTKEKKVDKTLKKTSSDVITQMENKVTETQAVINNLQTSVDNSVDDFEDKIQQVNRSAQITINSNGVIFYGGVGSTCFYDDECVTESTECRSKRCQCTVGLSYDMESRTCQETCDIYGDSYQSAVRCIIRGYNNRTMEDIDSFADCKKQCEDETDFTCKTIDYFPRWKQCFLSEYTRLDVPEEAFEHNSAGIHFQRDCALLG